MFTDERFLKAFLQWIKENGYYGKFAHLCSLILSEFNINSQEMWELYSNRKHFYPNVFGVWTTFNEWKEFHISNKDVSIIKLVIAKWLIYCVENDVIGRNQGQIRRNLLRSADRFLMSVGEDLEYHRCEYSDLPYELTIDLITNAPSIFLTYNIGYRFDKKLYI